MCGNSRLWGLGIIVFLLMASVARLLPPSNATEAGAFTRQKVR